MTQDLKKLSETQQYETVRDFLSYQLRVGPDDKLTVTSHLCRDFGLDTLDIAMLMFDVEQEFGISLSDEGSENVITLDDFINFTIKSIK